MTTRKDLPSEKSANFGQRLRETLQTYLGRQGNILDRGLTLRDLVEGGWAKFNGVAGDRAKLDFGDALINLAGGEKDLTPPPTPTGFAVNAGISYVFVETDAPTFSMGHGYLQTRVYGVTRAANAPLPVFTDAVEIAQFQGQIYAHPTNPATTWHLWVKWETIDGVLSVAPAGGVNGLAIRTGEDVALLLEALAGQITSGQLYQDLNSRIDLIDGEGANSVNARIAFETAARLQAQAQEVADRLAGIAAEAAERMQAIATEQAARAQGDADEAAARAQAIASEAATRNAQVAAEEQARVAALTAETNARNEAIAQEARARVEAANLEAIVRSRQIESTATGLLNQVLGADANRLAMEGTVALAKQELTTQIVEGISAEAAARLVLAAKVDDNTAIIAQESLTRATQDEALASQVNVLSTRTDENTAGILQEQAARTTAISAEATQRNLLATQFRGDYEGSDLNQVTSGLIFQERTARSSAVNGLAQQITLLSAGAGEQFDFSDIWYFDSGIEGWTGVSTPTAAAGWLKPVGGPGVTSPSGLAIDAAKYTQIRLRVRKTGTLTWNGVIAWNGGTTTAAEPTYDANGIGLVTADMPWTGTIDYISVAAYTTQDATNYYELDWIAIGRPSPGASSAQLYEEQVVRASQDAALSQSILTLTANLGAANALITSESTARATADQALTTQVNSLQTGLNGANAAITTEANTRSAADTAEASKRETLSVSLVGAAEPGSLTLATLASGLLAQERDTRVTQDNAISSQVTTVATNLGSLQSTVTTVQESVSTLTNSTAQSITTLTATDQNLQGQINQETTNRTAAIATAQSSLTAYVDAGLSAEATARTNLASTVGANTAAINQEATTRSTNDAALSTRIDQVVASVDNAVTSATALVQSEAQARADADTVAASQTLRIVAASNRKGDPVTAQGLLQAVLAGEKEVQARNETQATIQQAFTTELKDGLFAESQARLALTARVGVNESAIVQEQTTRATADEAVTSALTVMIAQTGADASAAIVAESQARTTAISAEAAARSLLAARVTDAEAEIVSEAQARATADEAVTSTLTALIAQTGADANAAVVAESQARTNADSAEAAARSLLAARVTTAEAQIVSESQARATADESVTNAMTALIAQTGAAANAAVASESQARTTAISAETTARNAQVATLQDADATLSAAILNESNIRLSQDSALVSQINTLAARVTVRPNLLANGGFENGFTGWTAEGVGSNSWVAADGIWGRTATLSTGSPLNGIGLLRSNWFPVQAGANYVIHGDALLFGDASSLAYFDIIYGDPSGTILSDSSQNAKNATFDFAPDDTNRAHFAFQSTAPVGFTQAYARFVFDATNATAIGCRMIKVERGDLPYTPYTAERALIENSAAITNEATLRVNADNALSSQISTVSAVANNNAALIQSEATTRANADGALSSSINQVQARLDTGDYAAVKVESSATANKVTGLEAQYSVKLDTNGYVSGFGLYNQGSSSEFIVNANRFAVTSPETSIPLWAPNTVYPENSIARVSGQSSYTLVARIGGTSGSVAPSGLGIGSQIWDGGVKWQVASRVPFAVQSVPTTINGVSVPAGVYIDAAYILNATIKGAQIGALAVDDTHIANLDVGKLTAGSIKAGQFIQSSNYIPGTSGFRLNADGYAEFGNATVRGTVYATNGQFYGTLLGGSASGYGVGTGLFSGESGGYKWRVGNPGGARIQWTGSGVEIYNASNQLTLTSGGIDWDKVNSKPVFGALAAQNSVDYGTQVGGLKPPADADKTSANTAAGIANQGAFATLNQINTSNVGTYIASLAVGELQIANNAITENTAIPWKAIYAPMGDTTAYRRSFGATRDESPIEFRLSTATLALAGKRMSITFSVTIDNYSAGDCDICVYIQPETSPGVFADVGPSFTVSTGSMSIYGSHGGKVASRTLSGVAPNSATGNVRIELFFRDGELDAGDRTNTLVYMEGGLILGLKK